MNYESKKKRMETNLHKTPKKGKSKTKMKCTHSEKEDENVHTLTHLHVKVKPKMSGAIVMYFILTSIPLFRFFTHCESE